MFKLYVLRNSEVCERLVKELKSSPSLLSTFTIIDAQLGTEQRIKDGVNCVPTIITFDGRKYDGPAAFEFTRKQLQLFSDQPLFRYEQLVNQHLRHRLHILDGKMDRVLALLERKGTQAGPQPRQVASDGPLGVESTEDSALLKPSVIITKAKESLDATTLMQQRQNFHPHSR